ncbi:MAG: hypothetical protein ACYC0X_26450 [Pirellulaceae bacterium]
MRLPSLILDSRMLESWQEDLHGAGYSVVEENVSKGRPEVKSRVQEQLFLVRLSDDWVRILAFHKMDSGETGLVAMTHQRGSSADLAKRIFAHLSDASLDRKS